MRNPLKKLQKKINKRMASKAALHAPPELGGESESQSNLDQTAATMDYSSTSKGNVNESPLFNNRSSKLRLAASESKKGSKNDANSLHLSPGTTPGKKKRVGSRFSFGSGRKSLPGESQPQPIPTMTPESATEIEVEHDGSRSPSPGFDEPTIPTSSDKPEAAPKEETICHPSPVTPSSNPRICAPSTASPTSPASSTPRSYETPTKASQLKVRDKVEVASYVKSQRNDADEKNEDAAFHTPPKTNGTSSMATKPPLTSKSSQTVPAKKSVQQKQKQVIMDPNMERIARAAAALDNTGNELFEKGEYDKAMANYVKALKLKNRTLLKAQNENEEQGGAIDKTHPSTGKVHNSVPSKSPTASPGDASNSAAADDLWISVATSINNIGYLRQQSGQASAEETMQAYQNSLDIKRRVLGSDNLSVGKTLNNLGTVHYLKRDYAKALEAYQEALQIMKTTLGPHHLDVGTVHSNIGDVYWAQSGDTTDDQNSPQRNYQASRNSALQHYRRSLEIRWEELQDHHDPKVIRLLEKIAALEMGESFLELVKNSHKHRQTPKNGGSQPATPRKSPLTEADEAIEAETSKPHVQDELHTLHAEVREDVKKINLMERKMAIDMVKDKLRLIREMKKLSTLNIYDSFDDESETNEEGMVTPSRVPPLSPQQRSEALSSVKERLQQLRDSRKKEELGESAWNRTTLGSDLKEADRSPSHFFLSHRASQILNRMTQGSSPGMEGLDELRRFSFGNAIEKDSEAAGELDENAEKETSLVVSPRASNALGQGIDALRSLQASSSQPWMVSSSMSESPEMRSPISPPPFSSPSMTAC